MLFYLLSSLIFFQTLDQIGFSQFELKEDSLLNIDIESQNLTAYILSPEESQGMLQIIDETNQSNSLTLNKDIIFCTDTNIRIMVGKNISKINIWILPSDLCGLNARAFKTGQRIFSRWIFTSSIDNLCYFPLNSPKSSFDISFLIPSKTQIRGSTTLYAYFNNEIRPIFNISNHYAENKIEYPFFIRVNKAEPDTMFAYDFHFVSSVQDICVDQQLLYFNYSDFSMNSIKGFGDPVFACSNDILNSILIKMLLSFICLFIICGILFGLYSLVRCITKPRKNNEHLLQVSSYEIITI